MQVLTSSEYMLISVGIRFKVEDNLSKWWLLEFKNLKTEIVNLFCIKVSDMSSINDSRENEFAYEESNIVGISENTPEEKDKRILKSIKKEILKEEDKPDM